MPDAPEAIFVNGRISGGACLPAADPEALPEARCMKTIRSGAVVFDRA